jgi:hypothetical protein
LPMMPGVPERRTHSYVRHGTRDMACSFVFGAPCQVRRWRGRSTAGTIH